MRSTFWKRGFTGSLLLGALLVVAGCSLAPTYDVPATPGVSGAFKEAPQESLAGEALGAWKTAQPAENMARGEWWKVFGDAKLDELEQQARIIKDVRQAAINVVPLSLSRIVVREDEVEVERFRADCAVVRDQVQGLVTRAVETILTGLVVA